MSAGTESNGTSNGAAVLNRVIAARAAAARNGEKLPGRDALVEALGISSWQAQQALKKLKEKPISPPPDTADPTDADALEDRTDNPDRNHPPLTDEAPDAALSDPASPEAPHVIGKAPRPWPLVLIGFAAAVAVWSGWVGLGTKCGFGLIQPLPGIVDDFTLNTAITLPISVEAYAAYALRVWLSISHHSARTITFAKWSTVISLGIGVGAQAGYHLLEAFSYDHAPWPVVLVVSSVPVAMVGAASGLAKLVKDDRQGGAQ